MLLFQPVLAFLLPPPIQYRSFQDINSLNIVPDIVLDITVQVALAEGLSRIATLHTAHVRKARELSVT